MPIRARRRSLSGSRRLTWPRTPAWCAYGCRTRPSRASGTRACGASRRGRTRSSRWPTIGLANQLAEQRIQRVVLESTSDYWRPFYYLLDARGLTVWLVNARDVKHVSGRPKTDKLDAVGLAKLNERGML